MAITRTIGIALAGALLLIVGAITNSWWSLSQGPASVHVGLRELEMCYSGVCSSIDFSQLASGAQSTSSFGFFTFLTYWLSLATAVATVGYAFGQHRLVGDAPKRVLGWACALVIFSGVGTLVAIPGGIGIGMSWGFLATLFGAGVASYSVFFDFAEGSDAWRSFEKNPAPSPSVSAPHFEPAEPAQKPAVVPIDIPAETPPGPDSPGW